MHKIKLLIKLLAHTRDIEEGKGEYALSIAIIKELMKHEHHKKICIALCHGNVKISIP